MFLYMNLFNRLIGHDKFQLAAFYDVGVADEQGVEDFAVQFNLFDVFVQNILKSQIFYTKHR